MGTPKWAGLLGGALLLCCAALLSHPPFRGNAVELAVGDCGRLSQARDLILKARATLDRKADAELSTLRGKHGVRLAASARKQQLVLLPSKPAAILRTAARAQRTAAVAAAPAEAAPMAVAKPKPPMAVAKPKPPMAVAKPAPMAVAKPNAPMAVAKPTAPMAVASAEAPVSVAKPAPLSAAVAAATAAAAVQKLATDGTRITKKDLEAFVKDTVANPEP